MNTRSDALILPSDRPVEDGQLKKMLLFFDSVTIGHPDDYALIHNKEVTEKFGAMNIWWADMNHYPREAGYVEATKDLLQRTNTEQNRGLVRTTPKRSPIFLDPGFNYTLWHSAIANRSLVEAAAPDRYASAQPLVEIAGYMRGGHLSVAGYTSKYEIKETNPAVEFEDVDLKWTLLAHLRLARALKYLRLGHSLGLVPVAMDEPSRNILGSCDEFGRAVEQSNQSPFGTGKLPFHLDFEILDALDLMKALDGASWKEVNQLRKFTLPGMNRLRSHLIKISRLQGRQHQGDITAYTNQLTLLYQDFENTKNSLREEWMNFGVSLAGRTVASLGGGGAASMLAGTMGQSWFGLLQSILVSGLIGAASLSSDIKTLLVANRRFKQQPLYFLDLVDSHL